MNIEKTITCNNSETAILPLNMVCRIISIILHPFILPLYGFLIILFGNTFLNLIYLKVKLNILLLATITLIIIPALSIYLLRKIGVIKNLSLTSRKDRIIPMLIVAIGYMLYAYYFTGNNVLNILNQLMWAAFLSLLCCLFINFFWKISLHMTAIGGLIAFILYINTHNYGYTPVLIYVSIILAGLLASSRLYLQKHNSMQILAGIIVGFTLTSLTLMY